MASFTWMLKLCSFVWGSYSDQETWNHWRWKARVQEEEQREASISELMAAQLSLSPLGAEVEMNLQWANAGHGDALFDQRLGYFLTAGPKSCHRCTLSSDTRGGASRDNQWVKENFNVTLRAQQHFHYAGPLLLASDSRNTIPCWTPTPLVICSGAKLQRSRKTRGMSSIAKHVLSAAVWCQITKETRNM